MLIRFAALADIHGNADALRAVLADIDAFGVSDLVVLRDHFSGPLDAAGTATLLHSRQLSAIRGNHDRYLIETPRHEMHPSDAVAYDQLSTRDLSWLRSLPATLTIDDILLCHATPTDDETYWLETLTPDGTPHAAPLNLITPHVTDLPHSLILCAHTHVPRSIRIPDGPLIVNPGSVGCPAYDDIHPVPHIMQTGTPDASYALLERGPGGWHATFRTLPYDASRMADAARGHGRADWAQAVTTGWLSPAANSR
ncbi:putative phosphoesterase, ICC [Puniceibacterium sp. IMCC21224]|nr:putative phosphoesterase, ICC [Puniceibacterium sp. IMCC21224]